MCGLLSFLSLHPSNCIMPSTVAHTQCLGSPGSCLRAGKPISFYLPCKSTDVWNVSKCTQASLGFRHGFSPDDLFGILVPKCIPGRQASLLFLANCLCLLLSQPMCCGQHTYVATSAVSRLPRPRARQITTGV